MSIVSDRTVREVVMDMTPSQAEAAAQDGAVLVLAGAGTGKTKTLTAAVVNRIRAFGVPPQRVLAVTFTNKAPAK
jgi:DNA helicase-2/ATP-dependent DNA helicase PcrA